MDTKKKEKNIFFSFFDALSSWDSRILRTGIYGTSGPPVGMGRRSR